MKLLKIAWPSPFNRTPIRTDALSFEEFFFDGRETLRTQKQKINFVGGFKPSASCIFYNTCKSKNWFPLALNKGNWKVLFASHGKNDDNRDDQAASRLIFALKFRWTKAKKQGERRRYSLLAAHRLRSSLTCFSFFLLSFSKFCSQARIF